MVSRRGPGGSAGGMREELRERLAVWPSSLRLRGGPSARAGSLPEWEPSEDETLQVGASRARCREDASPRAASGTHDVHSLGPFERTEALTPLGPSSSERRGVGSTRLPPRAVRRAANPNVPGPSSHSSPRPIDHLSVPLRISFAYHFPCRRSFVSYFSPLSVQASTPRFILCSSSGLVCSPSETRTG